ncbi:hypothetical protein VTJ04DRAFT_8820 [Mycothermus thermophilus]|uniref:uncharacterized protein n=1 Tax=Humicola insolens TaxID=85995 RepID=UPI0037432E70
MWSRLEGEEDVRGWIVPSTLRIVNIPGRPTLPAAPILQVWKSWNLPELASISIYIAALPPSIDFLSFPSLYHSQAYCSSPAATSTRQTGFFQVIVPTAFRYQT